MPVFICVTLILILSYFVYDKIAQRCLLKNPVVMMVVLHNG